MSSTQLVYCSDQQSYQGKTVKTLFNKEYRKREHLTRAESWIWAGLVTLTFDRVTVDMWAAVISRRIKTDFSDQPLLLEVVNYNIYERLCNLF